MIQKIKKKRKKLGVTLVEIMVASGVFAIAYAGLLVGQQMARQKVEYSLTSFVILQHAHGLLEAIQSYAYEDPTYPHTSSDSADATAAFITHTANLGGTYDPNSGVYDASDTLRIPLPEESLSIATHNTVVPSTATALNPFQRQGLNPNSYLLGPEDDDIRFDSLPPLFKISETERALNIFGNGQEKYYFMNDVDDFDGYRETMEVLPGITVIFDVSVTGVFRNSQDYIYMVRNAGPPASDVGTETIPQSRFGVMQPTVGAATGSISIADFQTLFPLINTSDNPTDQAQQMCYGYYNQMLMKKITVKATWTYPAGSNRVLTLVIDGGKVNPTGDVLA
ncbi:MAG: hypothetical protein JW774_07035 [Candidatus Aureabacteria bacterium]|nr:hypothetical protein [Candidatus Auribacterota bacterium]